MGANQGHALAYFAGERDALPWLSRQDDDDMDGSGEDADADA